MSHTHHHDRLEKEHTNDSDVRHYGGGESLKPMLTLSPEQFETLYLDSKRQVTGDLRTTFGNPTPLGVLGFVVALLPLSIALMGWRGSGGGAAATTAASIWFGCVMLWIAGILEFFLGNTFPFIVYMSYGAHFLTFATTGIPWFNTTGPYLAQGGGGMASFNASFGFYPVSMCMLSFIFLICSIRTNALFVVIFFFATTGFGTAAGAYFAYAQGNLDTGNSCLVATGACFFAAAVVGWYLLAAIMFTIMDLPSMPIFDLSTKVKGVSERRTAKAATTSEGM